MTLEERVERIICASEVELAGEAYILNNLRKIYTNLSTGNKITLSHNSAGKLALHWKDGEAYQKSIAHVPRIIESMQFLEEMKPDKEGASFENYSYYITPANIASESYTILSTVGRVEQEIYYDHNIFKGTPAEVFAKAKSETSDKKYHRLNKILQDTKG